MATLNIGRVRPTYKGAWNNTSAYIALDFVHYTDDVLYIALKDVPANYEPDSQVEFWAPFGSRGLTGNGIASFTFVEAQAAGNLWRMVFTDGTEVDILIPKGDEGDKGNGIVSINFDKVLDDGSYQYAIVMDNGDVFNITAPQGPAVRSIRRPSVEIEGAPVVDKAAFKVRISPYAALFDSVFAERVIDIALDAAFTQLVITATITPEDEEKNLYIAPQLLLTYDTKYYVRARDKDAAGEYSDYSVAVFATTKAEVREIKKPTVVFPAASEVITTLIPSFTFSAPEWVASTGAIDQMQVIVSRGSMVISNSGWINLVSLYTPTDFEYEWGRDYSVTVQYKESATGLISPLSDKRAYTTRAAYVVAPTIVFPLEGGLISATGIAIQSSAFSSVGSSDTHRASRWFIYGDAAGTELLWDSGRSTLNLTSITANPTPALAADKNVWLAVTYEGELLGQSVRSPLLAAKIGKINAPSVIAPTASEIVFRTVTVATGPFSVTAGSDTHLTTNYKITSDVAGKNVVAQELNSTDKLSHTFEAFTFTDGNTYYAWAAHNGSVYGAGAYSTPVAFVLKNAVDAWVAETGNTISGYGSVLKISNGDIIAFNGLVNTRVSSDGALVWARQHSIGQYACASAILNSNNVVCGIYSSASSGFIVIMRTDILGNILWALKEPAPVYKTIGLACYDNNVYYGSVIRESGIRLCCFDSNGKSLWTRNATGLAGLMEFGNMCCAKYSALFTANYSSFYGYLYITRWTMSGDIEWTRRIQTPSNASGIPCRVCVVGDKVIAVIYLNEYAHITSMTPDGDFIASMSVNMPTSRRDNTMLSISALSDNAFAIVSSQYPGTKKYDIAVVSDDLRVLSVKTLTVPKEVYTGELDIFGIDAKNIIVVGPNAMTDGLHAMIAKLDISAGDYSCGSYVLNDVPNISATPWLGAFSSFSYTVNNTAYNIPTINTSITNVSPKITVYPARA